MCYKNDTDDNEFIEQVDEKELAAIASTPTDNFMFKIDNFDALQSIKDRLAVRTCKGRFFFLQRVSFVCRITLLRIRDNFCTK